MLGDRVDVPAVDVGAGVDVGPSLPDELRQRPPAQLTVN